MTAVFFLFRPPTITGSTSGIFLKIDYILIFPWKLFGEGLSIKEHRGSLNLLLFNTISLMNETEFEGDVIMCILIGYSQYHL